MSSEVSTKFSPKVIYNNLFFSRLLHGVGRLFLWATGWKIACGVPEEPKFVAIAGPHTSNWDFPIFMAAVGLLKLHVSFLGKHTLFKGPIGWFFFWLGGIPVERGGKSASDIVDQAVAAFDTRERLILGIAPEGTRSKVSKWKTGFYRIALAAEVPILPAYLDSRTKEIGFGPLFYPTGDMEKDLSVLQAFYADKRGVSPKNQ